MKGSLSFALGARLLRGKAGTARYLRGAVLGIALSLVPLIVVMEVSTGLIEGITTRLIEAGTYHLQIILPPSTGRQALEELARSAAASPAAVSVIPERQGTALLAAGGASAGVTLRFVPPDLLVRDPALRSLIRFRSGSADAGPGVLLLGAALADRMGLRVGDSIAVLTPFSESGKGPPRLTMARVGGIFESGYQELDKAYAFADLGSSWAMLSPRASRTLIGVKVRDPFGDITAAARDVRRALSSAARVYTWRELEYARLASFQTTKALLLFIMAMIVLVAGVNVSSSVIMIAFERRLELGILKSIGAAPASLARAFLGAGFATGLAGTAAGVGLGLLAAVNINEILTGLQALLNTLAGAVSLVRQGLAPGAAPLAPFTLFNSAYYLSTIPVRIRWGEIFLAAAGTMALSGFASYLPAARAARVRPLEVIRKV
jgi:lipoprotein-releasing system permease protein